MGTAGDRAKALYRDLLENGWALAHLTEEVSGGPFGTVEEAERSKEAVAWMREQLRQKCRADRLRVRTAATYYYGTRRVMGLLAVRIDAALDEAARTAILAETGYHVCAVSPDDSPLLWPGRGWLFCPYCGASIESPRDHFRYDRSE